ncbi:MAG: uncharacterized protein KVP18_002555 [Porospora cf. gigantea A]|uniref:uncharacterized protein n=1 Tax=Porospora cf. gigantea A TaxID=2853593 RepID=UPI003559631F|nr:MAG: hypothetical protein KVP18_002555 [Porospora cf. gigantea A]
MSGSKTTEKTDALGRKVWDKDHFARVAEEKKTFGDEVDLSVKRVQPKIPANQRTFLRTRDERVDLTLELNKTKTVNLHGARNEQGGFFCMHCDCLLKDSQSWLDHINGKKHNQMLGMNMKVEKKGRDAVRKRLQLLHQLQKKK